MSDWTVPRCSHGHIILGCPHDDCVAQNEYLEAQAAVLDAWHARQQAEARALVDAVLRGETP